MSDQMRNRSNVKCYHALSRTSAQFLNTVKSLQIRTYIFEPNCFDAYAMTKIHGFRLSVLKLDAYDLSRMSFQ